MTEKILPSFGSVHTYESRIILLEEEYGWIRDSQHVNEGTRLRRTILLPPGSTYENQTSPIPLSKTR